MPLDIIIIGGGLAGLTAAISLAPSAHRIRIFERSKKYERQGFGITFMPISHRYLEELQIDMDIARPCVMNRVVSKDIYDAHSVMESDMREKLKDLGVEWPVVNIKRDDLHAALLVKAAEYTNIEIRFGIGVSDIDPEEGRITLTDGQLERGDVIVAADGIRSIAYDKIPLPRGDNSNWHSKPCRLPSRLHNCMLDVQVALRDPIIAEYLTGMRYQDTLTRYSDAKLDAPAPGQKPREDQGQSLMQLVISDKRFICLQPHRPLQSAVDDTGPWTRRISLEEFCDDAQVDKMANVLQRMIRASSHFERWTLGFRDCPSSFVNGRLVLIGDSAHPANPRGAAGAGLGVEDGVVLGVLLATADRETVTHRLDLFNRVRYDRCVTIKCYSDQFGRPENSGSAEDMLDYLLPGAKFPTDMARYLFCEDPAGRAREALEEGANQIQEHAILAGIPQQLAEIQSRTTADRMQDTPIAWPLAQAEPRFISSTPLEHRSEFHQSVQGYNVVPDDKEVGSLVDEKERHTTERWLGEWLSFLCLRA